MALFNQKNGVTLRAHRGDAMTLLAFDLDEALIREPNFVGFTLSYFVPDDPKEYFLFNRLRFDTQEPQPQHLEELPSSEAPFQKFRWVHVPGNYHQGLNETFYGKYRYRLSPRFWDAANDRLLAADPELQVELTVDVAPFRDKNIEVGFARGFMTSQAYRKRFGEQTRIRPNSDDLLFDIKSISGTAPDGQPFTYEEQHVWMGYFARERIFALLFEMETDPECSLDVFAYDFDEPAIAEKLLKFAAEGRLRIILDDHLAEPLKDHFAGLFQQQAAAPSKMVRAHFARQAHKKIFILKRKGIPEKVLTGSTNFSTNGLYINANHVLVLNDRSVAKLYEDVFETCLDDQQRQKFRDSAFAQDPIPVSISGASEMTISFAPHNGPVRDRILEEVAALIDGAQRSVLFSVMLLSTPSRVIKRLKALQGNSSLFTYGVTDQTDSVTLYKPGQKKGILVNAKAISTDLPEPFLDEVRTNAHFIHHKFVVVDFNGANPAVVCGSSNLAEGGEAQNGDNLLIIKDTEIATAFAIEAIRLIDHYHFRASLKAKTQAGPPRPIFLRKNNFWAKPYLDPNDTKMLDRKLFAERPPA